MTWILSLGIVLSVWMFIILWESISNKYPLVVSKIVQVAFIVILLFIFTTLVHQAIWG